MCAVVFAIHPSVMATVLVWNNPFDLLAALFGLPAVRAAYDWLEDGRAMMLIATLLFSLAAMVSKEVGIAVLAPIFLFWLGAAMRDPRNARWWQHRHRSSQPPPCIWPGAGRCLELRQAISPTCRSPS